MRNIRDNVHQSEEDLKMQVRKIMQFLTRDSIQLIRDMGRNKLEAEVGNHCSVGYVVRIIIRVIVHSIGVVVHPKSIVLKRHLQLVMLVIEFRGLHNYGQ